MKIKDFFAIRKNILLSAILLLVGNISFAQTTSPAKPITGGGSSQQNIILSSDEDYLIGANDILEIKVKDADELSGFFKLNSKGTFLLPNIGKIDARDKTIEQLSQLITKRLKDGYLINPIVSLRVSQSNRRAFLIHGAVRQPGTYQIQGNVSLLKLITIAGGLTDEHGTMAYVRRENAKNDNQNSNGYDQIKVNINELLKGDNKNIKIAAGDIVFIPKADEFFISGQVKKPGAFQIKETTTIQQAISLAGGLSEKSGSTAFLMREKDELTNPNGEDLEVIEINLTQLLSGRLGKNIFIKPRDFLHITEAGIFYVGGEVKEPGAFQITKEGVSLRQAISLAKGTNYEGNLKRSVIYRQNSKGEREKIEVNLAAIMKGQAEDVAIYSNDIVIIPNSKSKTVTKSFFEVLTRTVPVILGRGIF